MRQPVDDRSCKNFHDLIEAWIDGELDARESETLEGHSASCETCRAARRSAEELVAELRSLPRFDPPDRVVREAVAVRRPRLEARFGGLLGSGRMRPLGAVAAVACLVLMAVLLGPWRGPRESRVSEEDAVRAAGEARLALAYVAQTKIRAEKYVSQKVSNSRATARTLDRFRNTMKAIDGSLAATADASATPSRSGEGG